MVSFSQSPIVFIFIISGWLVCVCVSLPVAEWGAGEGGGKWLFVLSEPDLLIMVIVTVTHSQIRLRQEYYHRGRQ